MDVTFGILHGTKDGRVVAGTSTRTLRENDVYIRTTHSGLCGTDEHFIKHGCALGHEGVGYVERLGPAVTSVRVGDRVGFGYTHKVCETCADCVTGWDQYCQRREVYGVHNHDIGSIGEGVVYDAGCVFPIPERMDSVHAVPLICAGATAWTVLTEYGVQPGDRVGVLGIGGLGHLAIKLAAAMGCQVVALSSSEFKREDALAFGASEYLALHPGMDFHEFKPLGHLLVCGRVNPDYMQLIPLLATHGSIYPLTASTQSCPVNLTELNLKGVRIQGSLHASRRALRNLLEFAAANNILPEVMEFPLTAEGAHAAMEILRDGKMKYRGVLIAGKTGCGPFSV